MILGLLTRYFSLPRDMRSSAEETRNAYLYATGDVSDCMQCVCNLLIGMVLLAFLISICHTHSFILGEEIGMGCRIMMTSAIYKKVCAVYQTPSFSLVSLSFLQLATLRLARRLIYSCFLQEFRNSGKFFCNLGGSGKNWQLLATM